MNRRRYLRAAFAVACLFAGSAFAEAPVEWRLVTQDDFDRAAVGGRYLVEKGAAVLADGQLRISGGGATILLNVPIARDIRVEFDARTPPEAPVGGLGCLLHASSGDHYVVTFGAGGGRTNRIVGPGLDAADKTPKTHRVPGQSYRVRVQREGKRISLSVDDTEILAAAVERVVGSAGTQRIGFVTDGVMLVDNLRVYQRIPAHPDCCPPPLPWLPLTRRGRTVVATPGTAAPGLDEALDALNRGAFDEARRRFEAMDDAVLTLTGLAYLLARPDYPERPVYGDLVNRKEKTDYTPAEIAEYFGEFGQFAERWKDEAQRHPENEILKSYLPYVEHFGRLCLNRWTGRAHAEALEGLDDRINPFLHKAMLYRARFTYWNGMEGGNEALKDEGRTVLRRLLALYPNSRVLQEYVGQSPPWGEELNADVDAHPAWAAYLREAYARELAVVERMCDLRQRSDGQFGGGFGDDVEMLRQIVAIAGISTCSEKVLAGVQRLAEGVWKYECRDGYAHYVSDVEHSAEPSADAFPTMLLLRYGDPRYYEFNLQSAKTIRDKFMAIDERGYPRFLSGVFGGDGVNTGVRAGGDTGYHARAMKHFLWLAWLGNAEAKDWYLRWLDGWRAACVEDAPDKPAGVLPGTLWYPRGDWRHKWTDKAWYYEDLAHIYGPFGLGRMLHESFLAAYALSGDAKFLRPQQLLMDWATIGPLQSDRERNALPPGTRDWFRLPMAHTAHATQTSLYRSLTGERVYDEYTMRFGNAAQLYPIDHNLDRLCDGIEKAAKSLRTKLWYWTTETLSTDRLYLPAVPEVWGAYTGAITATGDCEWPTFAVTYETPSADFAALVLDDTPKRLRVWLYSFWEQPTPIVLRVWRLEPGEYVLNQGEKIKGEFPFQNRYKWIAPRRVRITHRAEPVAITLPPGMVYAVDLRQDAPVAVPASACDLAVHPRDVAVQGNVVELTLHNVGTAAASDLAVALQRFDAGEWRTIATQRVDRLSQPVNLTPFTARVAFEPPELDLTARYRLVVDPADEIYEFCETNNVAELLADPPKPPASRPGEDDPAVAGRPAELRLDLGDGHAIELALIPPGEFVMDASVGENVPPRHRVRIDKPLYVGKYEITQFQWDRISRAKPAHFQGDDARPVENVSLAMAREFCERLSRRTGRPVRLPSEAEWEYASRAGSKGPFAFGDDAALLKEYAWYAANAGGTTHPVGAKKPNAWGLYDVHGNVAEWVAEAQETFRGGAFDSASPLDLVCSRRDHAPSGTRTNRVGLRIVVPAEAVAAVKP